MARQNAAIAPGRRQRIMRTLEARNARRFEESAVRAYDLVVSPSPEDAARLSPDVVVVPNGVDTRRFRSSSPASAPRVVFTGALHTLPNRDGIVWFCECVWPLIRREVSDAALEVVGAQPPDEVRALAEIEGVTVHADVPDVVPFLENARVAVVPIRIGTGSRLKALEAMAAGRPVVGTTIGMGGLDVRPGQDALIADEANALAGAVVRCLRDPELASALGAQGRTVVEDRYSWSRIAAAYASLLDERTSLPSNETEMAGLARA
jgi:glycosyltransferase involved in cell wall biosynthesis